MAKYKMGDQVKNHRNRRGVVTAICHGRYTVTYEDGSVDANMKVTHLKKSKKKKPWVDNGRVGSQNILDCKRERRKKRQYE